MRLAEGLRYIMDNKELFWASKDVLKKDEKNRYMAGDIIYAEVSYDAEYERYIDRTMEVECDGRKLQPLVKYYNLSREVTDNLRQRVVFRDSIL